MTRIHADLFAHGWTRMDIFAHGWTRMDTEYFDEE
jgi:hypothetical protein